ncbi:MAG: hypothetical protein RRY54_04380 [Angelakisella sp.]
MAKKKDMGTGAANMEKATEKKGLLGGKRKKTIVVALVLLLVVMVSIFVDSSLRNPRTKSEDDAMNQIFGQNVVSDNPEIVYETPVEIKTYPPEKINGKEYWQVDVIGGDEPNTKLYGPYYVRSRDSKIFIKDASGQLIPYGV